MKAIYLYGAGGLGREIQSLLHMLPEWKLEGFFDDGVPQGSMINGVMVAGGLPAVREHSELNLTLAIGSPTVKAGILKDLKNLPVNFPVLCHPTALLQDEPNIELGKGIIITAGVILTTGIRIGNHVLLNLNCTIGHDVSIGDYTSVMPGVHIAGGVKIGNEVLIGSGANILNGITVGNNATVGAGAVVIRNVNAGETVIGVPARTVN
jgi:sugar O-acyltransferase (sialic acid O-acetyltransferase NeuD family)